MDSSGEQKNGLENSYQRPFYGVRVEKIDRKSQSTIFLREHTLKSPSEPLITNIYHENIEKGALQDRF